MTTFAKSPAFPQPHVIYDPRQEKMVLHSEFGAWPGLNIQQHVDSPWSTVLQGLREGRVQSHNGGV